MTPDQVFSIANTVALCAWILLVVLPRQRWVSGILAPIVMPAFFALIYVAIIATQWKGSAGGFSTLSAVGMLFSQPWLLLAGWVHYLAFDLFVGSWEVRDAREHGIPHLAVVPCLLLTFLFGPAGWLLYRLIRATYRVRIPA
jgi:tetrahydromethanopterin S-methyltransferase subunit D